MASNSFIGWIIFFPLLGSIINGLFGAIPWKGFPRLSFHVSSAFACLSVLASFVVSVSLFFNLRGGEGYEHFLFPWIEVSNFSAPMLLRFDALSGLLCLIVTGIGFCIHVYSVGYMREDKKSSALFYLLKLVYRLYAYFNSWRKPPYFIHWLGGGWFMLLLINWVLV